MASEYGKIIHISIFGESHSAGIGVVIDGLPAGEPINLDEILMFMGRRAPGKNTYATKRVEKDIPQIISGIHNGRTCGTPIAIVIENTDAHSDDYEKIKACPRPSHADYPAFIKYGDAHDIRGGGHFSGRLTAPLCFAGALCMQVLSRHGIEIAAHISSIGSVHDDSFNPVGTTSDFIKSLREKAFPVINCEAGEKMQQEIEAARSDGDSVGGRIECFISGMPAGIGEPMFDGLENRIAQIVFGIPAIKGLEFGVGFQIADMRGSEANDPYYMQDGEVLTASNNNGGILGGISTGMPVIFSVAVKPTPSISKEQQTVDLQRNKNETLEIIGRHDPCIVPRAVPCVEAAAAIAILDLYYERLAKK